MGRQARVRVLVADDHPLYRDGIIRAIKGRPDLELVGVSDDGRDALAQIQQLEPDVAVLDMSLPSLSGTQVVTALADARSPTKVLVLSAYTDSAIVYDSIAAGARGYITKDAGRQTICDGIVRVSRGQTAFSTDLHDGLAGEIRERRYDERPKLSAREREILALAAEGRSGPEIAALPQSLHRQDAPGEHLRQARGLGPRGRRGQGASAGGAAVRGVAARRFWPLDRSVATIALTLPGLAVYAVGFAHGSHERVFDPLTAVLAASALAANLAALELEQYLTLGGSFVPLTVAYVFLGPAPALAIALVSEIAVWVVQRYPVAAFLVNLVGVGLPNFAAGALFAKFSANHGDVAFYALIAAVASGALALNWFLVAGLSSLLHGEPILARLSDHVRLLPAIGVTVGIAIAACALYATEGLAAAVLALAAIPVFGYLGGQILTSREQNQRILDLLRSREELVGQVIAAEGRSRRALAEALHDDAVQSLLAARQDIEDAQSGDVGALQAAHGALEETVALLRDAVFELHPAVLERGGLLAALQAVADRQSRRGIFSVQLDVDPEAQGLADELIFSLGREFMTNAAKHSGATEVQVRVRRLSDRVVLETVDNGDGCDPSNAAAAVRSGHIGLASAAQRIEALGGSLELSSKLGHGTSVTAWLPDRTSMPRGGRAVSG